MHIRQLATMKTSCIAKISQTSYCLDRLGNKRATGHFQFSFHPNANKATIKKTAVISSF
jgi:hypothetical protein